MVEAHFARVNIMAVYEEERAEENTVQKLCSRSHKTTLPGCNNASNLGLFGEDCVMVTSVWLEKTVS